MGKAFFILFCVIFLLASVFSLFWFGIVRFNYPSQDIYPVKGIDISHHQGIIAWNEMGKESFDFVYMKATEGGDFVDPRFEINWDSAGEINMLKGAYHFYRICKNGSEQAENFISVVPKSPHALPHAIDLEHIGNCRTSKPKEFVLKEISDYINRIEKHYGKTPIIYTTDRFYKEYLMDEYFEAKIWIRNIFKRPNLPDGRNWHLWQFTNRARIRGVEAYVDLNVFNGDRVAFEQFVSGH